MNYRIAMIDDESEQTQNMQNIISRYNTEHPNNNFVLDVFHAPQQFLDSYRGDYDVVFLDIVMPEISGMDIARRIRERDDEVMLVFITNMAQYALESYDVHAYDFILKPIDYDGFCIKFDRICTALSHRLGNTEITLSFGATQKRVRICDITFIESANHNLVVHTTDGEFRMRESLANMEKKLASFHFVRCNSYYLVNLRYVMEVHGDYVVVDKSELKVSHLKRPLFLGELAKYMGGTV